MSRYECPACDGGFPELPPDKDCPWCGQPMDKSYSPGPDTPSLAPETSVDLDNIGSNGGGSIDIDRDRAPGTTPCPECEDPMPMVTWTGPKPKCRKCSAKERENGVDYT